MPPPKGIRKVSDAVWEIPDDLQAGDARAGARLRLGAAPAGDGRRRLRPGHQRRDAPRDRPLRLLHAGRPLGVRLPHRRRRGDGPAHRRDLPGRHRLRHQLRDAPAPDESHRGGGAAAAAGARRRPLRADSRRRRQPGLPRPDAGALPQGRRAGGALVHPRGVRLGGGPRAHRGGRVHRRAPTPRRSATGRSSAAAPRSAPSAPGTTTSRSRSRGRRTSSTTRWPAPSASRCRTRSSSCSTAAAAASATRWPRTTS